jgi:hypothetical protein
MESEKKPTRINAELIYYQLAEIKSELAEMKVAYVTKAESHALKFQIEELQKDLIDSKQALSEEIAEIKKARNFWGWFSPTLTAVVTAVFTYIVIEFLRKR